VAARPIYTPVMQHFQFVSVSRRASFELHARLKERGLMSVNSTIGSSVVVATAAEPSALAPAPRGCCTVYHCRCG
jgi:hypothetical protein